MIVAAPYAWSVSGFSAIAAGAGKGAFSARQPPAGVTGRKGADS